MERPTLILDADDTLWETNVFYEEAIDAFVERMEREGFTPEEAREVFSQVEHERVPETGYSPWEFARSMAVAYRRLCERHGLEPRPEVAEEAEAIGRRVVRYPIRLRDGVAEALPELRRRCRLLVLTKGDPEVQRDKIRRSGLAPYFDAVHVVPEKDPEVLRDLVQRYGLDPRQTWVVGDSPRSDINPALEVGLGAVHFPHECPWAFEEVPIAAPERVVTLRSFADLLHLFPDAEGRG